MAEQIEWGVDTSVKDYLIDACDDCTRTDNSYCMECCCASEYEGPDADKVRLAAEDWLRVLKRVFG